MLFNSLEFLVFLPLVFAAYWILNLWTGTRAGLRAQNLLVLAASYVFYGWWDWRFLSLIAFSTLVDYAVGLQIILPVGISFYTFQTLSYSIDIYRRRLEPSKDLIAFAAFVSFFPQLVAGPIERASALLPQIAKRRHFDYDLAVSGMRLILWGIRRRSVRIVKWNHIQSTRKNDFLAPLVTHITTG